MASLETNFSVGDTVYWATTIMRTHRRDCPDCLGENEWKAISPAGREYKFTCPRCGSQYQSNADLSLEYAQHVGEARKLTIGSISVDTAERDRDPVSYMCKETGVGSGSVYRQSDLFETEAEALIAAKLKAKEQNEKTDWIVKQYDKTLRLCDYQIGDAALQAARNLSNKRAARIQSLFSDFEWAETAEDFRDIIERWKARAEKEGE